MLIRDALHFPLSQITGIGELMCIVCLDWEKGKLTNKEAMKNLGEMLNSTKDDGIRDHLFGLSNKIIDSEFPPIAVDEELDLKWWEESHES